MCIIEAAYQKCSKQLGAVPVAANKLISSISILGPSLRGHILGIYKTPPDENTLWAKSRIAEASTQLQKSGKSIRCALLCATSSDMLLDDAEDVMDCIQRNMVQHGAVTHVLLSELCSDGDGMLGFRQHIYSTQGETECVPLQDFSSRFVGLPVVKQS